MTAYTQRLTLKDKYSTVVAFLKCRPSKERKTKKKTLMGNHSLFLRPAHLLFFEKQTRRKHNILIGLLTNAYIAFGRTAYLNIYSILMDNIEREIQDTTSLAEKDRVQNMSIAQEEQCSRCKRLYLNTEKGCNVFTKWCPECAEETRNLVLGEELAGNTVDDKCCCGCGFGVRKSIGSYSCSTTGKKVYDISCLYSMDTEGVPVPCANCASLDPAYDRDLSGLGQEDSSEIQQQMENDGTNDLSTKGASENDGSNNLPAKDALDLTLDEMITMFAVLFSSKDVKLSVVVKLNAIHESFTIQADFVNWPSGSRKLYCRVGNNIPKLYWYEVFGAMISSKSRFFVTPCLFQDTELVLVAILKTRCNSPNFAALVYNRESGVVTIFTKGSKWEAQYTCDITGAFDNDAMNRY
jgi:hypothetical protein